MASTIIDKTWLTSLQKFIYHVITAKAVPTSTPDREKIRKQLVGQEAMHIWIRAFTHDSYEPNQEGNYQSLEYFGDQEMASKLTLIVMAKRPDISEDALTNIKNAEVMKEEQAKISDELGLAKYVRSRVAPTIDIREDLLESTFGGLYLVGEKVLGEGNGSVLSQNLMIDLYGKKEFDIDNILKNKKTQLKEIGDKLQWWGRETATIDNFGLPQEIKDENGITKEYRLVYRLTDNAKNWMRRNNKPLVNDGIIAAVNRPRKRDVINAAVDEALDNLKKFYAIDLETATEKSHAKQIDNKIRDRTQEDGLSELQISTFGGEDGDKYYQLVGKYPNGRLVVIYTFIDKSSGMEKRIKDIIYKKYARGEKWNPDVIIQLVDEI